MRGMFLGAGTLCLGNAFAVGYEGGHKTVTLVLWFAVGCLLLLVGLAFWIGIHRRNSQAGGPPSTPTSVTFHGGKLGGSAKLRITSTADRLAHETEIGDQVELHADHHPGNTKEPPGRQLDSDCGSPEKSEHEHGSPG